MLNKKIIEDLLNLYFKNDVRFDIYKKFIFKVVGFSKKNFNILTPDFFFYISEVIDLNDIDKLIFIIKSLNIKIFKHFPNNYIFSLYNNKKLNEYYVKENEYFCFDFYNKDNHKLIKNKYKKINLYLSNISNIFSTNNFLINNIFKVKKKKILKNIINKLSCIKSNISFGFPVKMNFFKYKNRFFFESYLKKSKKNFENFLNNNNDVFFDLKKKIILKNTFFFLNFISDIAFKYRKKGNRDYYNLFKFIKTRKITFKMSLSMIDFFYRIIKKKYNTLMELKYSLYNYIKNISNINYFKFNFLFLKNGSNLNWIYNNITYNSSNNNLKKNLDIFLFEKKNEINNIEKNYFTEFKDFFKIFVFIETNKIKIDIIRNEIFKSKLNFSDNLTKKYYFNETYNDLVQESRISLINSINNYNFKLCKNINKFINYNTKRFINKYIYSDNKLIRIPENIISDFRKINEVIKNYNYKYNLNPNLKYISNALNIKKKRINTILELCKNYSSINKISDNNKYEFEEFIKDKKNPNFDEEIFNNDLKSYVEEISFNLNDNRSSNVINMRYGLEFSRRYTLAEVGELYGVSRERIRQIQKKVIEDIKLLHPEIRLRNFFKSSNNYYNIK